MSGLRGVPCDGGWACEGPGRRRSLRGGAQAPGRKAELQGRATRGGWGRQAAVPGLKPWLPRVDTALKQLRQIREYEQRLKGLEQEVRPQVRLWVVAGVRPMQFAAGALT